MTESYMNILFIGLIVMVIITFLQSSIIDFLLELKTSNEFLKELRAVIIFTVLSFLFILMNAFNAASRI